MAKRDFLDEVVDERTARNPEFRKWLMLPQGDASSWPRWPRSAARATSLRLPLPPNA